MRHDNFVVVSEKVVVMPGEAILATETPHATRPVLDELMLAADGDHVYFNSQGERNGECYRNRNC